MRGGGAFARPLVCPLGSFPCSRVPGKRFSTSWLPDANRNSCRPRTESCRQAARRRATGRIHAATSTCAEGKGGSRNNPRPEHQAAYPLPAHGNDPLIPASLKQPAHLPNDLESCCRDDHTEGKSPYGLRFLIASDMTNLRRQDLRHASCHT